MSNRRTLLLLATLAACLLLVPVSALAVMPGDPNEAESNSRGFDPSKIYGSFDIDHVDLFSGSLRITIPIGQEYPVDGALSYGLTLVYNSSVFSYHPIPELRDEELIDVPEAVPNPLSNAGLGWMVTFGRLIPPDTDVLNEDLDHWLYVAPDGSQHMLYDTLHEEDTAVTEVWYTRDSTYIRMSGDDSAGPLTLEFPSGLIHTFNLVDTRWEVTQIQDRFGNQVSIARPSELLWTISDDHGRTHEIHFVDTQTDLPLKQIDEIEFDTFGGTESTWEFVYANRSVERGCRDDSSENSENVFVPLLVEIKMPHNETYLFKDDSGNPYYYDDCDGDPGAATGRITGARLTTKGLIRWDWRAYVVPRLREWVPMTPGPGQPFVNAPGVASRALYEPDGLTLIGEWLYDNGSDAPGGCNQSSCDSLERTWTVVVPPVAGCSKHSFSASQLRQDGWLWAYGLPFDQLTLDNSRYLSTGSWTTYTATGNMIPYQLAYECSGEKLREAWVEYDHDTLPIDEGEDGRYQHDSNRRLKRSRTIYVDDANRQADTTYSDFDGLGHYRTTTTDGNFPGQDLKVQFSNFNPGDMPGAGDPWLINLYDEISVTEAGATATVEYAFDSDTGFLDCQRSRTNPSGSRASTDLVALFGGDASGNRTSEAYWGGDIPANAGTGGVCSTGAGAAKYRIDHTYSNGALATSQYSGVSFKSFEATIDPNTGLVKTSKDSAEIETIYTFDGLGRLKTQIPETGHGGQTQYTYTEATWTGGMFTPARVGIERKSNNGTATLAESEIVFDALGRVHKERRKMANGTWSERETLYNARGWKASVSEWGNLTSKTVFAGYDPFGRPGSITAPDGKVTSFAYSGISSLQRTASIQMSGGAVNVTTEEIYDRHGRLYSVAEPSSADTFTYTYDEENRLIGVDGGGVQTRSFTYDPRGILTSECHPEKGASGNGCVTYTNYDPRGHVGQIADGPNTLKYSYDAAERVLTIKNGSDQDVKAFTYDSATNNGAGKIHTAVRHNRVDLPGDDADTISDIVVTETYDYNAKGGRVSSRLTTHTANDLEFLQSYTYTDLGDVSQLTYPHCQSSTDCPTGEPTRAVENTYVNGWLTKVGDDGDDEQYAKAIAYHPNGMWSTITRGSNVVDNQSLYGNSMRRPRAISVTGVSSGTAFDTGDYAYDGAGNITAMGTDSFYYDNRMRLKGATVHGNQMVFNFDDFGNMTSYVTNGTPTSFSIDSSTNRIDAPGTATYDAAGNTVSLSGITFDYDEFNQLTHREPDGGPNDDSLWTALYTADDERLAVLDASGGFQGRWTIRDLDGRVLSQYLYNVNSGELLFSDGFESGDTCTWSETVGGPVCLMAPLMSSEWYWSRDYIYREGQLLVEIDGGEILHLHIDHLGSLRQVTDGDKEIVEDHDFLPFGQEVTDPTVETLLFTGHERDSHTGSAMDDLDYMHARYYSSNVGRFLSVDPVDSAIQTKPQSWNRYVYAIDNPIRYVDPNGQTVVGFTGLSNKEGGITEAIGMLQRFPNAVGAARQFRNQDQIYGTAFLLEEFTSDASQINVLVGHSLGAYAAVGAANTLSKVGGGVPVDLLITVDAALNFGAVRVPSNVKRAINFYQPGGMGGTQLTAQDPSKTNVLNIGIRSAKHTTIDDFVVASIVGEILNLASKKGKGLGIKTGLQFVHGELIFVSE